MDEWVINTAYLWGVLLLIPVWLFIFYKRKDLRCKLWHTGRAFGIASVVLGQLFTSDYWNPHYAFGPYFPLEDFLYGLIYAGITTVIYQFIFQVKFSSETIISTKRLTLLFAGISFITLYIFIKQLNLNSIFGQIIMLILVGIYTIIKRPDLLKHIIISSFSVTLFTFLWQSIILWIYPKGVMDNWEANALFNVYLFKVPLEELLFAFSIGWGGSFFYEVSNGKLICEK